MLVYFLISEEDDVYNNLAYETCLVDCVSKYADEKIVILYLWKNDRTIVVGKNQNLYKECNLDFVKKNDIKLSRRITGGGAVYHDKGNLNFSFIASKSIYSKEENFQIIINALNKLGINAVLSGRNDILINGKKFSGNAFFNNKFCSLHHGTILINSSSEIISKCLTPNKFKLKSKGVKSVKSRIINLKTINPDITSEKLINSIKTEFINYYNAAPLYKIDIDKEKFDKAYKKYSSKEWIYGEFSDEGLEISKNFSWGNVSINMLIKDKIIDNICISTDALETEIFDKIVNDLKGQILNKENIEKILNHKNEITEGIKKMILSSIK